MRMDKSAPGRPDAKHCNVFHLHSYFTGEAERKDIAEQCKKADIGCSDCKKRLAASLEEVIAPIREKAKRIDDDEVKEVLQEGGRRAKQFAQATVTEVREALGYRMV